MTLDNSFNELTHAGGVVYREGDAGIELLLVTARADPSVWVLPRGHIEADERPEEAAVREVLEEAGVATRVVAPLGVVQLTAGDRRQWIAFYLMERIGEMSALEERQVVWLPPDAAARRVSFEESRALLERGRALLDARSDG